MSMILVPAEQVENGAIGAYEAAIGGRRVILPISEPITRPVSIPNGWGNPTRGSGYYYNTGPHYLGADAGCVLRPTGRTVERDLGFCHERRRCVSETWAEIEVIYPRG